MTAHRLAGTHHSQQHHQHQHHPPRSLSLSLGIDMVLGGSTMALGRVLGQIPCETLGDDLVATCEQEWASRMVRWALAPVTGTAAAEHILTPGTIAGVRYLVVYNRNAPSMPLCAVEAAGCNAGRVSAVTAFLH